VNIFKVQNSN